MSDVLTASGGSREDTTHERWPPRSAAVYRLGIRRYPVEEEWWRGNVPLVDTQDVWLARSE